MVIIGVSPSSLEGFHTAPKGLIKTFQNLFLKLIELLSSLCRVFVTTLLHSLSAQSFVQQHTGRLPATMGPHHTFQNMKFLCNNPELAINSFHSA